MLIDFNPDVFSSADEADLAAANLSKLQKYCAVRAQAIRDRLAGDIAEAMRREEYLDKLYAELPEELRW